MKKFKTLAIYLVSSIVIGTAAAVGFAYSSYVYNRQYETPVEFNSGVLSGYFEGGNGTSSDPYSIRYPQQLRNLQRLNVLGVFSENTHFKLDDNIPSSGLEWDDVDLLPIGSEDYPFYSQFNGNGKRINGLEVNGSQTNDIGMFGYVAMGSRIENFLLSSPIIRVTADNNPSASSSTNPFANLFADPANNIAATLGLNLTQKAGSTPAYFTPTLSSISASGTTYQIYYKSANESLLKYQNNRWEVQTPIDGKEGHYYPVQLSARIYGVYENKIISYTLERWHINVTYNGNVNIADPDNDINVGYWKTLHAVADEGMGPHKTYVGFFIGHLDGEAAFLGLYGGTSNSSTTNAKLIIQGRPVSSFSSLIGRTVNDNIKDDANGTFASRDFDFDYIISNAPSTPDAVNFTIPSDPINSSAVNTYMSTMDTRSRNISQYYSLTTGELDYMRFYPSLSSELTTIYTGQFDEYENEQTVDQYALSFDNKPLSAHVFNQRRTFLFTQFNLRRNFFLKNGIWMYLSAPLATGWGAFFTRKSTRYEAKIKVTYVASGDQGNYFQFLYNGWNPNATIPIIGSSYASFVSNTHWLNVTTLTDDDNLPVYDPTDYPIIQLDENDDPIENRLVEYEIEFEVNLNKAILQADYNFMMAMGVGAELDPSNSDYTVNSEDTYSYTNETFSKVGNFQLRILKLDLFFTSLEGQYSRQMSNVDYISSIPTYSSGVWSNWNKPSETRVYFDVGSAILSPGTTATYRFYRSASALFSASRVYGYHSIPSGSGWELKNTYGYSSAVLGNG
ncbi:MAG: hypothetical protein PHD98_02765 [Bacilli bacterium]|nr:hypothetical protein [Bacilli bacterium]